MTAAMSLLQKTLLKDSTPRVHSDNADNGEQHNHADWIISDSQHLSPSDATLSAND